MGAGAGDSWVDPKTLVFTAVWIYSAKFYELQLRWCCVSARRDSQTRC